MPITSNNDLFKLDTFTDKCPDHTLTNEDNIPFYQIFFKELENYEGIFGFDNCRDEIFFAKKKGEKKTLRNKKLLAFQYELLRKYQDSSYYVPWLSVPIQKNELIKVFAQPYHLSKRRLSRKIRKLIEKRSSNLVLESSNPPTITATWESTNGTSLNESQIAKGQNIILSINTTLIPTKPYETIIIKNSSGNILGKFRVLFLTKIIQNIIVFIGEFTDNTKESIDFYLPNQPELSNERKLFDSIIIEANSRYFSQAAVELLPITKGIIFYDSNDKILNISDFKVSFSSAASNFEVHSIEEKINELYDQVDHFKLSDDENKYLPNNSCFIFIYPEEFYTTKVENGAPAPNIKGKSNTKGFSNLNKPVVLTKYGSTKSPVFLAHEIGHALGLEHIWKFIETHPNIILNSLNLGFENLYGILVDSKFKHTDSKHYFSNPEFCNFLLNSRDNGFYSAVDGIAYDTDYSQEKAEIIKEKMKERIPLLLAVFKKYSTNNIMDYRDEVGGFEKLKFFTKNQWDTMRTTALKNNLAIKK